MIAKLRNILPVVLITLLVSSLLHAAQLYLEPSAVCTIASPQDNRDQRLLLFFNLPNELNMPGVEIEQAVLLIKGHIWDADVGQIDVYPLTREWYQAGNVSWNTPWEDPGGDYTTANMGRSVTMKHSQSMRLMRLNVTFMVKAWLDGVMDNNGLIVMFSQDDLKNSLIKIDIDRTSPMLKIRYENRKNF